MSDTTGPTISVQRAHEASASTLAADVLAGLKRPLMELPPKHLYDPLGSQLFDEITTLPEYYLTRAERAILQAHATRVAERTSATELVELGAGTASKTGVLLDALSANGQLSSYAPFDIDERTLLDTATRVAAQYDALDSVDCVVGDFEHDLNLLAPDSRTGPRIVALLGGTIGNLKTPARRQLLSEISGLLDDADFLLLGTDLVKDPVVLEAAYNDTAGVTAHFNRNVLAVINRELGADFPTQRFAHVAFYDAQQQWIEMRLRALGSFTVRIEAIETMLSFEAGDEIRTEISAKFTPHRLHSDLAASGLEAVAVMTDPDQMFALTLARPRATV